MQLDHKSSPEYICKTNVHLKVSKMQRPLVQTKGSNRVSTDSKTMFIAVSNLQTDGSYSRNDAKRKTWI